jgi:hypothetical protein
MKQKLSTALMAAVLILFTLPAQSYSQAPDTVDVPNVIDNSMMGAINKFILGDTTENGERNNINRVYRLSRGLIYFFDSEMEVHFPLTLIADDDDPNNPTFPPVLARGILQDNSSPNGLIWAYDDATFKNLYFTGVRPDEDRLNWSRAIRMYGDEHRYIFENCVFEDWAYVSIRQYGRNPKIYIRDCHFKNAIHPTQFFGGQGFASEVLPTDTVIMTNNTFFNNGSYLFCPNREIVNYSLIEHNTIFTTHVNVFYAPYVHNSYYKNNIFYGIGAMGQTDEEIQMGWFDWKGEISAIFSIDTIPSDIASREGISEADRVVEFKNNAYYWPQQMKDFWTNQNLSPMQWINNRTQAMLDDDASYPGLLAEGNVEADPGFNADVMAQVGELMGYCTRLREGTQTDQSHYYFGEGNSLLFPPAWPLPENLAYSNTDLLTAGTDGLPLGDLNWYPDKKEEWLTGIKEGTRGVPSDFELFQNYPNPFNPETTIKFNLKKSSRVTLTIYNSLGQKIRTLVNRRMSAGVHEITWNTLDNSGLSMASGVYFFRLSTGSSSQTKKMMFVK